jgi:transcriptional regulator with XRE-family HTH domain
LTTIGDVARAAGVSAATVSRVLNGSATVSSERADRVRQAAEALRYQPSGPARALRRQRTTLWAAIVADIENPFFTSMIRGVEDVALRENHRLVLCNTDEDVDKEAAYVDVAIADRMAGVIIAVASTTRSSLDPLVDAGIPVVAVDRRPQNAAIDSVLVDNRLGARLATEHLLDGGATRVACITGPARLSNAATRLAGYRDALAERGHRVDRTLVRRGRSPGRVLAARRAPPTRRHLRHQQPDDPGLAAGAARARLPRARRRHPRRLRRRAVDLAGLAAAQRRRAADGRDRSPGRRAAGLRGNGPPGAPRRPRPHAGRPRELPPWTDRLKPISYRATIGGRAGADKGEPHMDAPPTTPTFEVDIDDDQVAFFHENGYLAIDRITTDEEIEWLRGRFDELFEARRGGAPGAFFDTARPYDAEGADLFAQALFPELAVPACARPSS